MGKNGVLAAGRVRTARPAFTLIHGSCEMFNPLATHAALRERLLKDFEALNPARRTVMELLAVFYEPVGQKTLLQALNAIGPRQASGKAHTYETLRGLLGELILQGLAVETERSGVRCPPALAEPLARRAVAGGRFSSLAGAVQRAQPVYKQSWSNRFDYKTYERGVREARIALYEQKWLEFNNHLEGLYQAYSWQYEQDPPLLRLFADPFDPEWVGSLPEDLMCTAARVVLDDAALRLIPQPEALALVEAYCRRSGAQFGHAMRPVLAEQYVLGGRWKEAAALATDHDVSGDQVVSAWLAFLQGRDGEAVALYEDALKMIRRGSRQRNATFSTLPGQFYPLALLRAGDPTGRRKAAAYLALAMKSSRSQPFEHAPMLFHLLLAELEGRHLDFELLSTVTARAMAADAVSALLGHLVGYWCGVKPTRADLERLESLAREAQAAGYGWLAREAAALLGRLKPKRAPAGLGNPEALAPGCAGPLLVDAIKREEPWERALSALSGLVAPGAPAAEAPGKTADSRLTWRIQLYDYFTEIKPYEQRLDAHGAWTGGRPVALKRLATDRDRLDWLTPQDRRICEAIKAYTTYGGSYRRGRYADSGYTIESTLALPALAGHPLVFWADHPDAPVEVALGRPELHVEQQPGGLLLLTLKLGLREQDKVRVVKESLARVRVIPVGEEHRRLAGILGAGLSVPEAGRERVLAAMAALAPLVSVHSEIGAAGEALEDVAADPTPHLLLMPAGGGLRAEVVVRPLGESGAVAPPGRGGATLIAEVEGRRVQARRDLARERELADRLEATLAPVGDVEDAAQGIWTIGDPERCLELLEALRELPEGSVIIEWPKGGRLSVSAPASFAQLRLTVRSERDWFSLSGQLRADEGLTIEMQRLLELLEATPGRFIPLGEGRFLALTRELRRRLEELRALAEPHGKKLRVHGVAAPALAELAGAAGAFKADAEWQGLLERIREAQALQPEVPSTLRAELRDYQREGYAWLARLAHWGAGACLADDMGLGKTVQALALLLARAAGGPALVVAPTSVGLNWAAETARFAPTLTVRMLGGAGQERRAIVEALGPFDVLVTSYDLMQREGELLAGRRWNTIVLDEAQAIKNMATRRSRAAMKLQGDFRLITTGTPLENNLGEMWNLFRFLNPGLLGSLERFNQRFAGPIERQHDRDARARLKKILQPFMLRRTRAQVLEELPPRTEILLEVEAGDEEASFYEALRRVALERLEGSEGPAEQQRFRILAEIMRLRRACCNPRLVAPDAAVPSAKLEAFGELVEELRESGHKALVFSQFTDHLALVRAFLDERAVAYQYLDGTMSPAERQRAVAAFQEGQGELFLISLKAGGTGLNLTAADYVIHLDPWWNPAVEDQATGRAHRMGQEQPVTVYRLVLRGTIEQKIVDLHRHKRDLADSLLEGADAAGRLSPEDLLALLRQG